MISENTKVNKEIWNNLIQFLEQNTGKKPSDLNAVLFLIGVQELGQGHKNFSKEEKQDLMHIALCKVLSLGGYYRLSHNDQDGWPHYEYISQVPGKDFKSQEEIIKFYVVEYFKSEIGLHI
jgi:hypothetical protein